MFAIIAAAAIWGDAPICSFDGYTYGCFYYSYEACESATKDTGNQRCVPNPS